MEKKRIGAEELHDIMDEVIRGLLSGTIDKGLAKEISNAAGKKIGIVKTQLDYAYMWGGKIEIPFLSSGNEIKYLPGERKSRVK